LLNFVRFFITKYVVLRAVYKLSQSARAITLIF